MQEPTNNERNKEICCKITEDLSQLDTASQVDIINGVRDMLIAGHESKKEEHLQQAEMHAKKVEILKQGTL